MSRFDAMNDQELKRYFLDHRNDQEAFYTYLDRRHTRPKKVIIEAGELDHLPWDEQVKVTGERMLEHFGDQLDKERSRP